MADKQPDALELAEAIQYDVDIGWLIETGCDQVADKLRRQHALIAELVEALEEVVKTINDDPPSIADTIWCSSGLPCTLLDCCLMALAKAKEAQQ